MPFIGLHFIDAYQLKIEYFICVQKLLSDFSLHERQYLR